VIRALGALAVVAIALTLASPAAAQSARWRVFPETGFTVADGARGRFLSAFEAHGGVAALGYPASRPFVWEGFTAQVFQRAILQWRPERAEVAFVNVFDRLHAAGLDDELHARRQVPRPVAFADAGLTWEEAAALRLKVLDQDPAIRRAYHATAGDPIALHGLPVSPIVDMGNHLAVRCQRAVFQKWKVDVPWARAGDVTVALGGDIAKEFGALPDLAALQPDVAVAVPSRAPRIVLDPGHGGAEPGAVSAQPPLIEKEVVLAISLAVAEELRAAGYAVTLTRESDRAVNIDRRDLNGDGWVDVDDDLQARVDVANEAAADVFLSIHGNGGPPHLRGGAVYYCASCPGTEHRQFSLRIRDALSAVLPTLGAGLFGSGLFDEADLGKPYGHLFVIGPKTPRVARANRATAQALVEVLFLSNRADAAILATSTGRTAIARAISRAIQEHRPR